MLLLILININVDDNSDIVLLYVNIDVYIYLICWIGVFSRSAWYWKRIGSLVSIIVIIFSSMRMRR